MPIIFAILGFLCFAQGWVCVAVCCWILALLNLLINIAIMSD